uniref:Tick transposon n=1 Tax=Ascaris lumbricoides TaxID=6252 RepID=A0A0M3HV60_ASCLU
MTQAKFDFKTYIGHYVSQQVATESKAVLLQSTVAGAQVRQCSCDEQRECSSEMREQAVDCIGACWSQFRQVSDSFTSFLPHSDARVLSLSTAVLERSIALWMNKCVHSEVGPLIPKVNISELFRLGERAITHNADNLVRTTPKALRKILDAAGDFAICVKDCFLARNKNGFCFDSKNCQPLIVERELKKTLRKCTRAINWKKEAGELCDCSVNAGLS